MGFEPLVSVIIPSYNMARFLPEAIRSVLNQTYSNLEVHVVDDGSVDETREVVEEFRDDKRFVYHHQTNRGESGARNTGIRASRGELIALCDADDLWVPRKLELQVPCFNGREDLGVVYTNTVFVDERGNEISTYRTDRHSGWITQKLLLQNFVTGSTSMIRRECLRDELYDERLKTCADYDLWLRLSVKYQFQYLDDITYRYRRWDGQVSNPKNELRFFEDSEWVRRQFLERYPDVASADLINEMWASLYAGKAVCSSRVGLGKGTAFACVAKSLRHRPFRLATWKAGVKVLIGKT